MVQVELLKIDVRTPDLQGNQRAGENADERASFKGKHPGHICTVTIKRLGVRGGTLQGRRSNSRPKRTFSWKLGVDATFETGRLSVPSFSGIFSGTETTCWPRRQNNKITQFCSYAAETGIGLCASVMQKDRGA